MSCEVIVLFMLLLRMCVRLCRKGFKTYIAPVYKKNKEHEFAVCTLRLVLILYALGGNATHVFSAFAFLLW